jgi:DeoR/GlpR family transcriptional regulator of sugar metabolism
VLIGGEVEQLTDSFVGAIACHAASSLLYGAFFTSASAVDAIHGSSEVSLAEAQVKQVFAHASTDTVLCIDSSKLEQSDVALGLPWSSITIMITELNPSDPRLDPYRALAELR